MEKNTEAPVRVPPYRATDFNTGANYEYDPSSDHPIRHDVQQMQYSEQNLPYRPGGTASWERIYRIWCCGSGLGLAAWVLALLCCVTVPLGVLLARSTVGTDLIEGRPKPLIIA